jgi:suppressor for copper-sensitivity B
MTRRLSKSWSFLFATLLLPLVLAFAVQPAFAQPAPVERPASSAAEEPGNLLDRLQPPGQVGGFPDPGSAGGFGDFGLGDTFADREVTLSAAFTIATEGQPARLFVTAEMAPGWHVYSITQPAGAVKPTIVKLEASKGYVVQGEFVPDRAPEVRKTEVFPVPLEEHYGVVTFSAPIQIAPGEDAGQLSIAGELEGMVCHDERGCVPLSLVDTKFVARLATGQAARDLLAKVPGDADTPPAADATQPKPDSTAPSFAVDPRPAQAEEGYRADDTHVAIRGHIEPETVVPGATATLFLTALSDPDWHVYAYADKSVPGDISCPTRLVLQQPPGWRLGPVQASLAPTEKQEGEFPVVRYHEGSVTWKAEIHVPDDVPPGQYTLNGLIGYQTCSTVCERPTAAAFSTTLRVGPQPVPGQHELVFAATGERYQQVAALADSTAEQLASTDAAAIERTLVEPAAPEPAPWDGASESSTSAEAAEATGFSLKKTAENTASKLDDFTAFKFWAVVIPAALLGGLILNVMPCVLPVIGLKIMGFVNQAGESRARIFALNVWYALGLLSVFLILATPMALVNAADSPTLLQAGQDEGWGWGQQFNNDAFNIPIIAVVFVMALSFLGVWEIPIPGFAAGSTATKLAEKEGPAGAFAKGVVTTILATPCTGPGIAFAMTLCRAMSVPQVYIFFSAIALGMASPYLIIGAFPKLIKSLPKPGAWMETVKQVMGFVLLATVLWLYSNVQWVHMVPTLALLFGLGGACWWIGRVSYTAEFKVKARAWVGAAAFATLIGFFSFFGGATVGGFPIPGLAGMMEHRFQSSIETEIAKLPTAITDRERESTASADERSGAAPAVEPSGDTTTETTDEIAVENGSQAEKPENEFELPWQRFSIAKLEQLTAEKKTVMVDFTADWCLTCKTLEQFVLNTRAVREAVDRNGVVPLLGNWSSNPEVGTMLNALNSKQVPVLAIFPAGRPNDPIVLSGPYKKSTLISKLEEAGPSAGTLNEPRAAMRVQ